MLNTNRPAHVREHEDEAAHRIGTLFAEGKARHIDAGKLLNSKKVSMPPGAWTRWLKDNEKALGFSARTAERLMRWARCPDLEPEHVWQ